MGCTRSATGTCSAFRAAVTATPLPRRTPMTVETAPRRTEYIPLDHLQADPANPKAHDGDAIDASIGRFGIIDQIVQDDRTGFIISGHGRDESLRRMRDRGDNPPEGIRVDAGGHWLVPVIVGWASRTDAEARAALIALNRSTELGGWVDEALLDLLDNLDDYTGVGFTEDDTDDLRPSWTIWSMMPNRPIEASMASPSCAFGLAGSAWRWSSGMYSVRRGAVSTVIAVLLGSGVAVTAADLRALRVGDRDGRQTLRRAL